MVILYVSSYFITPSRIGFGCGTHTAPLVVDALLDSLFLVDVVVSFCTGYVEEGLLEMERSSVCQHYLATHGCIDLLSSLPIELLYTVFTNDRKSLMAKYMQLVRMGRFFRITRVLAYISNWQDQLSLNSNAMRIFKLAFLITVFSHFDACLQMFVAEIEGFPSDGWVRICGLHNAPVPVQYSHALFRALSHMLSIGYGPTSPNTLAEIWVTMLSMLVGTSFFIVLFGNMGALILSLDRSGARYEECIDSWQEYFRFCHLPVSLRHRVIAYFSQKYHTKKLFDERSMLQELPLCLRTDVQMYLCEELVTRVPLFKACRMVVVRALVSRMTREVFSPGDYVFLRDEPADNLHFILSGKIQIETEDGTVLTVLSSGSYFGEFALLAFYRGDQTTHRMANARSVACSDVYALSCEKFKQVADRFPEIVTLLESLALSRFRANEESEHYLQK